MDLSFMSSATTIESFMSISAQKCYQKVNLISINSIILIFKNSFQGTLYYWSVMMTHSYITYILSFYEDNLLRRNKRLVLSSSRAHLVIFLQFNLCVQRKPNFSQSALNTTPAISRTILLLHI
jgi:hypothetical protein